MPSRVDELNTEIAATQAAIDESTKIVDQYDAEMRDYLQATLPEHVVKGPWRLWPPHTQPDWESWAATYDPLALIATGLINFEQEIEQAQVDMDEAQAEIEALKEQLAGIA